jgi:hypothetical protein
MNPTDWEDNFQQIYYNDWGTHPADKLALMLSTIRSILLSQRQEILRECVEVMPEEKAQLDKNDPDNYGACYAIGGFNGCRAEAIKRIEGLTTKI